MTKTIRWGVTSLATLGVIGLASFVGCSSDSTPATTTDGGVDTGVADTGVDTGHDAGTTDTGHDSGPAETAAETSTDAGTDTAAETATETGTDTGPTDAGPSTVNVRVAHLAADAPAVDVCVTATPATGSPTWTGVTPALGTTINASGGVTYQQITGYISLPAGAYTVRVVAAGATNCNTEVVTGTTYALPALTGGQYATAIAYGLVSPGDAGAAAAFTVKAIIDDPASTITAGGGIYVRAFHAFPGAGGVDIGAPQAGVDGGAPSVNPSEIGWDNLPYGSATALGSGSTAAYPLVAADANQYVPLPDAVMGAALPALAAQIDPSGPLVGAWNVSLVADTLLSAYIVPGATGAPAVLVCNDTKTPVFPATPKTSCQLLTNFTM